MFVRGFRDYLSMFLNREYQRAIGELIKHWLVG